MIDTKLFEVRDRATCLIVLAQRFLPAAQDSLASLREQWCLERAGYGSPLNQGTYVALVPITGGDGHWTCDPYNHGHARTLGVIHQYLLDCEWDAVQSGQVLDVEYILGETGAPKLSEQVTHG